jgi:hypothetical protein
MVIGIVFILLDIDILGYSLGFVGSVLYLIKKLIKRQNTEYKHTSSTKYWFPSDF